MPIATRKGPPPLTLKCPSTKGEEWPATSYQSYLTTNIKFVTHDDITYLCPAGHKFTLRKAVEKGMFTPEEALKMMTMAQQNLPAAKAAVKEAVKQFKTNPSKKEEKHGTANKQGSNNAGRSRSGRDEQTTDDAAGPARD